MIPIPEDASHQDVEQWCSRGVVLVTRNEETVPAFFLANAPRNGIDVELLDGNTATVPRSSVFVHWPRCGSVNVHDRPYAVHVSRLTQRQYRRTWHVNGLRVVTPRAWDVAKFLNMTPNHVTISPRTLAKACFTPRYPSLDEAERMLTAGEAVTVAVSPSIIVAGDPTGKRIFYFNGTLTATAADGTVHPVGEEVAVKRIIKLLDGRYYASPSI